MPSRHQSNCSRRSSRPSGRIGMEVMSHVVDGITSDSIQHWGDTRYRPQQADRRREGCADRFIAGAEHRLADGEFLLWDDTFPHEVTNDSDEVRTVLLLDVWRRGMPLDMRFLSHLLIFFVRVMARLRGVGGAIG